MGGASQSTVEQCTAVRALIDACHPLPFGNIRREITDIHEGLADVDICPRCGVGRKSMYCLNRRETVCNREACRQNVHNPNVPAYFLIEYSPQMRGLKEIMNEYSPLLDTCTDMVNEAKRSIGECRDGFERIKNTCRERILAMIDKINRIGEEIKKRPEGILKYLYPEVIRHARDVDTHIKFVETAQEGLDKMTQQYRQYRTDLSDYEQFRNPRRKPKTPNPCNYDQQVKDDVLTMIQTIEYLGRNRDRITDHTTAIGGRLNRRLAQYAQPDRTKEALTYKIPLANRLCRLFQSRMSLEFKLIKLKESIEEDVGTKKRSNKAKCDHLVDNISILIRESLDDDNPLWMEEDPHRSKRVEEIPLLLEVLTREDHLSHSISRRNSTLARMERLPRFDGPLRYEEPYYMGVFCVDGLADINLDSLIHDNFRENILDSMDGYLRRYNLCRWDSTQSAEVMASLEGKMLDFVRRLNKVLNSNKVSSSRWRDLIRGRCARTLMQCLGMTCLHLLKKSEVLEETPTNTGVVSTLWGVDCGETFRLFTRNGERIFSREIVWGDMMIAAEYTVRGWDMYRVDEPNIRYTYRLDA